ncbi:MAG: thermonuclease family protein [Methylophilaceae bacterium]
MRPLLLLLLCLFNTAYAADFTAKVIAVMDGDTVLVRRGSGLVKIRLVEIDAPEKAQLFGDASKRSLSDMVLGKQVSVSSQALDQYGRTLAHLRIGSLEVNAEQIRRGMAWEYSNFHSSRALIALQTKAKKAQLGLWAQNNPTPPWMWRKQHPSTLSAATNAATSNPAIPAPTSGCAKKHCSEMTSCEEARYALAQCGVKTLDGDGDGVPCEKLCGGKE